MNVKSNYDFLHNESWLSGLRGLMLKSTDPDKWIDVASTHQPWCINMHAREWLSPPRRLRFHLLSMSLLTDYYIRRFWDRVTFSVNLNMDLFILHWDKWVPYVVPLRPEFTKITAWRNSQNPYLKKVFYHFSHYVSKKFNIKQWAAADVFVC